MPFSISISRLESNGFLVRCVSGVCVCALTVLDKMMRMFVCGLRLEFPQNYIPSLLFSLRKNNLAKHKKIIFFFQQNVRFNEFGCWALSLNKWKYSLLIGCFFFNFYSNFCSHLSLIARQFVSVNSIDGFWFFFSSSRSNPRAQFILITSKTMSQYVSACVKTSKRACQTSSGRYITEHDKYRKLK